LQDGVARSHRPPAVSLVLSSSHRSCPPPPPPPPPAPAPRVLAPPSAGYKPDRRRCRDYLRLLLKQRTGPVHVDLEGRNLDDVTAVQVPPQSVGTSARRLAPLALAGRARTLARPPRASRSRARACTRSCARPLSLSRSLLLARSHILNLGHNSESARARKHFGTSSPAHDTRARFASRSLLDPAESLSDLARTLARAIHPSTSVHPSDIHLEICSSIHPSIRPSVRSSWLNMQSVQLSAPRAASRSPAPA
jgi:hypothetical protein